MRAPRFSIGTLLAVIAILGVAMAALRSPSYLWAGVTFTAALLAVMASVSSAILARGACRAYWVGFSVFGGTYLAICTSPGLYDTVRPRLATEALLDFIYPFMAPDQPTHQVTWSWTKPVASWNADFTIFTPSPANPVSAPAPVSQPIAPAPARPAAVYDTINAGVTIPTEPASRWTVWTRPDRSVGVGATIGTVSLLSSDAFRRIGHSLFALLLAALGAAFARNRYEANASRVRITTEPAPRPRSDRSSEA